MNIRVNTLWEGKVAVRDKLIQKAVERGESLIISHNHGTMIIPAEEIEARIVARSLMPFPDRFSEGQHYLIYFGWSPEARQGCLL